MTKGEMVERLAKSLERSNAYPTIWTREAIVNAVLAELKAMGLAVVPREPTREMCHAARDTKHVDEYVKLVEAESSRLIGDPVTAPAHGSMMGYICWRAMIAASPYD